MSPPRVPRPYPCMQGSARAHHIFPWLLVETNMEAEKLNRTLCEEMFVIVIDVTKVPNESH